jgi:hypothetical protein
VCSSDLSEEKLRIDGAGVTTFKGGTTTGFQRILINNGQMTLAQDATFNAGSIRNTGTLVAVGAYRNGQQGVSYNHALFFGDYGSNHAMLMIADPSNTFSVTDGTANRINVHISGTSEVHIENRVAASNNITVASFEFQGL